MSNLLMDLIECGGFQKRLMEFIKKCESVGVGCEIKYANGGSNPSIKILLQNNVKVLEIIIWESGNCEISYAEFGSDKINDISKAIKNDQDLEKILFESINYFS